MYLADSLGRPPRRLSWSWILAVVTLIALWSSSAGAINIVLTFDAASSDSPSFDPSGTQLQAMMGAVESYWQDIIEDTATLNITYYWDDLSDTNATIGLHSNQGTSGGRPTDALIRFDTQRNGSERLWFFDPTPTNDSEFDMQQTLYRDVSGANQTNWYNGSPPDLLEVSFAGNATGSAPAAAQNGFDLFSVALHEMGHALGMTGAVASTETNDFDYDFDPDFVDGTTSAAETRASDNRYHLDAGGTMMFPTFGTGTRRLPSATDVFSIATGPSPGWSDIDLLRQDYWGGAVLSDGLNWEAGQVPGALDDAWIRTGSMLGTAKANMSFNSLTVGEGSWATTGPFKLDVGQTATIDGEGTGLSARIRVQTSGELEAGTVAAVNTGILDMEGGLTDTNTLTIDGDSRVEGNGTVDVQTVLTNNGTIRASDNATLTFTTSNAGGVFNLDGGILNIIFTEPGDLEATGGNLVFDGQLTDGFNGTLDVTGGHSATFNDGWELAAGSLLVFARGTANLNDGTIGGGLMSVNGDINVTGGTPSHIGAPVSFGSSADVSVASGSELELEGATTFAGGTYTGLGTIQQDGSATVSSATTIAVDQYDMDGTAGTTSLTLNNDLTLDVTRVDDGNNTYNGTLDINGSSTTLTVNTPAPWSMNGTMNIDTSTTFTFPSVDGQDFTLGGTANIDGGTRFDARVDITGDVIFVDASSRLAVLGGDALNPNTISGGTISGPGNIRAANQHALFGHGTISSDVDFLSLTQLRADDGTLTISGSFINLGIIGTADTDGVLNVTNPWNTSTADRLELEGGSVTGATITNDNLITGFGLISALVHNNAQVSASGGTLTFGNGAIGQDFDGATENGVLNALDGDMVLRSTGGTFGFDGTINISLGRELFVDDFDLGNNNCSTINLTGGTYRSNVANRFNGTITAGGATSEINSPGTFGSTSSNTLNADLELRRDMTIRSGANFTGPSALVNLAAATLTIEDGASIGVEVVNHGSLALGASPEQVKVKQFTQGAGGDWQVEIAGSSPSEFDSLLSVGSADLDGTLGLMGINSLPHVGDHSLTILTATPVNGVFSTVPALNDGDGAGHVGRGQFLEGVNYDAASVVVDIFQAAAGDINGNREVDAIDIQLILAANSFNNGPGFDWTEGDNNGDTKVDAVDIQNILATNLFGVPGPYAANPTGSGTPAGGVADLVINADGTATLDPNGLELNGFILRSPGGNFTGSAVLPTFFTINSPNEASVGFVSVNGLFDLGQLYDPSALPILDTDLDFTYTIASAGGSFDGNCIGCIPEPSSLLLAAFAVVGLAGGRWRRRR